MARAPRIWFVAAGTGGHIFPGISVAREIRRLSPQADILFFGTQDRLESTLVPKAGFPLKILSAAPWKGRGGLARFAALGSVAAGFFQVVALLCRQRPDVLVSVGGYVSVPTALACRMFLVPLVILEPNICSGLANRLLSRMARRAFCAPGSDALQKLKCPVVDAGNPVREDLRPMPVRETVRRVLVLGGSQGALALCRASLQAARDLKFAERGVQLVLQSGDKNLAASEQLRRDWGVEACTQIVPFIDDIPSALEAADVALARAGAMTVTELSVTGVPTVFVPFPFAADDHQRVNAQILERAGAAFMVDEREADFNGRLQAVLTQLCLAPDNLALRTRLAREFKRHGRPQATREITQQILSMLQARG
ncbi:MAG: UDP-N-acetylglucosamine--N-acetylmuramyl-(pentapeptide) pyrophosphoryl-undecaprenol N-acetylglucosamine transferase [Bdellovibrionales bacterium]|nr:UDP-N-acetylglucosamine--N-acetylmuramyl-(pentapeptide) pyrophosphoryl-undecaprenol N-acetylglucosamine transferase [Bdellovibrionales bacterium]